jgi:hypothetical protein
MMFSQEFLLLAALTLSAGCKSATSGSGGDRLPTQLAFSVQPSNTAAGTIIAPAPQVAVLDGSGNAVPTATNNVTVAIGKNPGGGTLAGTRTVAAVNGVATFSNLMVSNGGVGYTLTVSASGLVGATSEALNVVAVQITSSSPHNVVSLGGTIQFAATVVGTTNPAVTWSVRGSGTIDASGLYTAPSSFVSASVVATSVAYPAARGTAQIDCTCQP